MLSGGPEPTFLTVAEVDEIHQEQLELYGGSDGTRDPNALDAAVHMAQQSFGGTYVHTDIFEMAAAYLFHICLNHPYVDGNKRTAAEAADVFLYMNGYELGASEDEYEELVLVVAEHRVTKSQLAEFLRLHAAPR